MTNMYAAPQADLTQDHAVHSEHRTQFFSWNGRIGRIRFLAYVLALASSGMLGGALLMGMIFGFFAKQLRHLITNELSAIMGMSIVIVPLLAALIIFSRRRLHDLNVSAWFAVLWLLPSLAFAPMVLGAGTSVSNEILGLTILFLIPAFLYLTIAPGKAGENRFGSIPQANNLQLLLCILPTILFAGLAYLGSHRNSKPVKTSAIFHPTTSSSSSAAYLVL